MKKAIVLLTAILLMFGSTVYASDIDSDVIRPTTRLNTHSIPVKPIEHITVVKGDKDSGDYEEVLKEQDIPMGEAMPEAEYITLNGTSLSSEELLQDKKALVIHFFTAANPNAAKELSVLTQLESLYGDQAAFLALDYDLEESEEDLDELLNNGEEMAWVALEEGWILSDVIPFEDFSCTVILDQNGELVFYQEYELSETEELKPALDAILAEDYEGGYQELHLYADEQEHFNTEEPESYN